MSDRAVNFREIVSGVRDDDETTATVAGDGPTDVCRRLYRAIDERADPTTCEFYVSPNRRRAIERRILDDVAVDDEPFLERVIRTDVSMPADAVLFMHPDAVTIGGTVVGSHPVGVGLIEDAN